MRVLVKGQSKHGQRCVSIHDRRQQLIMDNLSLSPDATGALQNMSAKDKAELNQFVMQETQKAQIQQTVCCFVSPELNRTMLTHA